VEKVNDRNIRFVGMVSGKENELIPKSFAVRFDRPSDVTELIQHVEDLKKKLKPGEKSNDEPKDKSDKPSNMPNDGKSSENSVVESATRA